MIQLDLRNLTDELVAEAKPFIGQCFYSSPCIIGTLVPVEDRATLDNEDDLLNDIGTQPAIGALVTAGLVEFPDERQVELACELQRAFDNEGLRAFNKTLRKVRKELSA